MTISFLLVTCCLEKSRSDVLNLVIDNIRLSAPELLKTITVFDNASTDNSIKQRLVETFDNVFTADHNVGYWTAIDWWLTHETLNSPKFTYIIESDMIHYDFNKIWIASKFLENNEDIGAVRLHEYSIENKHLYNKDLPVKGSKKNIWQSHTNKVTQQPISIDITNGFVGIYPANFLTQLPALNRYRTMRRVFDELRPLEKFSELDFQRLYHKEYQQNAILDGGIFHCDPGCFGSKAVTGSWTSLDDLTKMGYQSTRYGSIVDPKQYTVSKLV